MKSKALALAVIFVLLISACVSTVPSPVEVSVAQHFSFIPIVIKPEYPWIGVQIENPAYVQLNALGFSWVRRWVRWDEVEYNQGQYDWEYPDAKIGPLEYFDVIAVLVTTPSWASANPEYRCGPPFFQYAGAFVDYVVSLVTRFPQVRAIAIYNEPESPPGPGGNMMGCFSTGAEYGRWVALVYPGIKAALPELIVIAGEFANLDSDFWRGALAEMGNSYDVISYHSYPWWTYLWHNTLDRADVLHASQSKPVWLTETATVGESEQANYLAWLMGNRAAHGIEVIVWYSLCGNGWPTWSETSSDMGEVCDGTWRPVFDVYKITERGGL